MNRQLRRRVGLAFVIAVAVVLSFSGLHDLAIACGFGWWLAIGVPLLADAGGALAADVWLDRVVPWPVRRYARALALSLISTSVLGNIASHVLEAYRLQPHWVLVVAVAALAPLVVATNLHLYVLVNRQEPDIQPPDIQEPERQEPERQEPDIQEPEPEPDFPAWERDLELVVADPPPVLEPLQDSPPDELERRARELVASGGGRGTLQKELGVSAYQARQLCDRLRDEKVVA